MAGQVTTFITLSTPLGVVAGDLLVAGIAITFQTRIASTSFPTGPCPGPVSVITPPAGWTTVLADFPGGENAFGDLGSGPECDRLAVFVREVAAVEPPTHTFSWAPNTASTAGFIKAFAQGTPGIPPVVDVAAPAAQITTVGGNPVNVIAPSVIPVHPQTLLLCFYVARASGFATVPFASPPGMGSPGFTPLNGDANNVQAGNAAFLDIGLFIESLATNAPTGTRTSPCTVQANDPSNPFSGMGYSLALAGCSD